MNLPDEKELKQYDRWGKSRPSHDEHGVADTVEHPLIERLVSGNPHNWVQEGYDLHCDTDFGHMVQRIPTNMILIGIDKKGLPKFKKL